MTTETNGKLGIVRVWIVPVMVTVMASIVVMGYLDFKHVVVSVRDQAEAIKIITATNWTLKDQIEFLQKEYYPLRETVGQMKDAKKD